LSLNDDNIKLEVIRLCENEGFTKTHVSYKLGIPRQTISDFLNKKTHTEWWEQLKDKPLASGTLTPPEERRSKLSGKRYVFTSAQNNTYVFGEFLDSLLTYCNHTGAELKIGTFTYNKKGFQNLQKDEGEWYDPKIVEFIDNSPGSLRDKIIWCGELNILPTAVNPLSGFDTYTKAASGVIPHPKVRLQSCPVGKNSDPKFLYTTGAVTKANYIQKTAGQKAEFHHINGALVVEFDERGDWFARHIIADTDGSFYDLDNKYNPDGSVLSNQRVEAVNYGDLHSEKPDPEVYAGSFIDSDSLLDTLKPRYQFAHDTLDFTSRNHHNIADMYFRLKNQVSRADTVEDDIRMAGGVLHAMERPFCQTVVVASNHDLALHRWLKNTDVRFDNINNVLFYHRCQVRMIEAIAQGTDEDFSIFESCVKDMYPALKAKFLKEDESFVICDSIECGNHGHLGPNGARGAVGSFKKLDTKQNVGHGHSASIVEGVYMAGISGNKDQGYNKGPSSWSHSHIVTYANGKRAIITMRGRKYKA